MDIRAKESIVTYQHHGGSRIVFDIQQLLMIASDGTTIVQIAIGIGGMQKLVRHLLQLVEVRK